MKEIVAPVTIEGHVALPREVMDNLAIEAPGAVRFVIDDTGTVRIGAPRAAEIAALRGAAGSLTEPMPWERMIETVREERADELARKSQ